MFAHYINTPTIRREVIIDGNNFSLEGTVLHFKNIPEPVRIGFIRTEEAEILLRSISGKNVAHHLTKLTGRLTVFFCWLFDFNCIVRKGWQVQVYQQLSTICMWISPHSTLTFRGQRGKFR